MIFTLTSLSVSLQGVAQRLEHFANLGLSDAVTLRAKFADKIRDTLACPPER